MTKSNTKGNLNTNAKTVISKKTTVETKDSPVNPMNVSGIIGVDSNINEELLTKNDPLIESTFNDKSDVNNTKAEVKLDLGEILDDRWNNFSK